MKCFIYYHRSHQKVKLYEIVGYIVYKFFPKMTLLQALDDTLWFWCSICMPESKECHSNGVKLDL